MNDNISNQGYKGKERRKFIRVPFIFPVNFKIVNKSDDEDRIYHALSDNISEGGLKIICLDPVDKDDEIEINFYLPIKDGMKEIKSNAQVVWKQEGNKKNFCGVQFINIKNEDKEAIRNFVNRIMEFKKDENI